MNWGDFDTTPEPLPTEYTTLTPKTLLAAALVSIPLWLLLFLAGYLIATVRFS